MCPFFSPRTPQSGQRSTFSFNSPVLRNTPLGPVLRNTPLGSSHSAISCEHEAVTSQKSGVCVMIHLFSPGSLRSRSALSRDNPSRQSTSSHESKTLSIKSLSFFLALPKPLIYNDEMKRKKRGRPKLGASKKKQLTTLSVRLLDSDADVIRYLAEKEGVSVSRWIFQKLALAG